eukprot:2350356-Amphidinium_carterae.1
MDAKASVLTARKRRRDCALEKTGRLRLYGRVRSLHCVCASPSLRASWAGDGRHRRLGPAGEPGEAHVRLRAGAHRARVG